MAGYSDHRELNMEMKYLYKVWSQVDSKVQLPPSLTGDALLPHIGGIHHSAPASRKIRFSPRVFTWQSGVTYAAAFVLIVVLSTFLGRVPSSSDMVVGDIPVDETETAVTPASGEAQAFSVEQPAPEMAAFGVADEADYAVPEADVDQPAAANSGPTAAVAAAPFANDALPDAEGVGGPGESVLLGIEGDYTYTYRPNDATDPDKGAFPITFSVMNATTKELAFMMDIPDMMMVESFFVYEGKLTIVGPGNSGVTLRTYDVTQVGEAVEQLVSFIPGLYLDANQYKNVVHVVTFADGEQQLDTEVIPLPDSTEQTHAVFTALDVETLSLAQKSFEGAGNEVSLHNLNAYLKYPGDVTEENETGQYVAQIRLDGMNIDLGSPQQPESK